MLQLYQHGLMRAVLVVAHARSIERSVSIARGSHPAKFAAIGIVRRKSWSDPSPQRGRLNGRSRAVGSFGEASEEALSGYYRPTQSTP